MWELPFPGVPCRCVPEHLSPIAVSPGREAGCRIVAPTVCHGHRVIDGKGNLRWSLSARLAGQVSESHVLLALRHRARPRVMAHTQYEGTARRGAPRGKQHYVASQPCTTLAPRGVATCDVRGCAGSCADRPVLRRGPHPCIHHRRIRGTRRVLTRGCRRRADRVVSPCSIRYGHSRPAASPIAMAIRSSLPQRGFAVHGRSIHASQRKREQIIAACN
jgi:hypothetical protein